MKLMNLCGFIMNQYGFATNLCGFYVEILDFTLKLMNLCGFCTEILDFYHETDVLTEYVEIQALCPSAMIMCLMHTKSGH